MADDPISSLPALGAAPDANDLFVVVDVSDTSEAPTGTTKSVTTSFAFTNPTVTGKVTVTGGTIVANTPVVDATQTWNNGAISFSAVRVNVTDTASASGSLLQDFRVGGVSQYSVDKSGNGRYAGTIVSAGLAITAAGATAILKTTTSSNPVYTLQDSLSNTVGALYWAQSDGLVHLGSAVDGTGLSIAPGGAARFSGAIGFNGVPAVGKQVSGGTNAGVIAGLVALGLFSS